MRHRGRLDLHGANRRRTRAGEVLVVPGDDIRGLALGNHPALLEQDDAITDELDRRRIVAHEHDGRVARTPLEHFSEALLLKRLVADGQHLVEQQNLSLHGDRNREGEPKLHPRGVRAHGLVDERTEPGEVDDLVEATIDHLPRNAEKAGVQIDVFATRELRAEAGAEIEQRSHRPSDLNRSGARTEHTSDYLEEGCLPGAVDADDAKPRARWDVERNTTERPEVLAGHPPPPQNCFLEREVALLRQAVTPPEIGDPDLAWAQSRGGPGSHSSAGNSS